MLWNETRRTIKLSCGRNATAIDEPELREVEVRAFRALYASTQSVSAMGIGKWRHWSLSAILTASINIKGVGLSSSPPVCSSALFGYKDKIIDESRYPFDNMNENPFSPLQSSNNIKREYL